MATIQSSGQISFSDLKSVFGGPAGTDIPLNNYYSGGSYVAANTRINNTIGTYVPSTGQISMNSFYDANTAQGDGWRYAIYRPDISNRYATVSKLLKDSSGYLYLIGTINIRFGSSFYIMKVDPSNFNILWNRTFGNDSGESVSDACIDSANNIIIVGKFDAGNSYTYPGQDIQNSALIIKYNSSGVLQWSARFGGQWQDYYYDVTTDSSNNIYVGGTSSSLEGSTSSQDTRPIIVKYNSSGTVLWQRSLTYLVGESVSGICFSGGFLYFNITSSNLNGSILVKYDSSGVLQWQKRIYGIQSFYTGRMKPDTSGGVFLIGRESFERVGYGQDIVLMNVNSSGSLVWARFIGGTGTDWGYDIDLDSSNNIYITGQTTSQAYGTYDSIVIKYDVSGVLQWVTGGGSAQTASAGLYDWFNTTQVINNYIYVGTQVLQSPNTSSANGSPAIFKFDPSLTLTTTIPPNAGSILSGGQSLFRKNFFDSSASSTYTIDTATMTDYARTLEINSVSATERAAPNSVFTFTGFVY